MKTSSAIISSEAPVYPSLAYATPPDAGRSSAASTGAARPAGTCMGPRIEPSDELAYWREHHATQRFATTRFAYEDFAPAYECGVIQFLHEPFVSFARAELRLESGWPRHRGRSRLPWRIARHAALAAWERVRANAHLNAAQP